MMGWVRMRSPRAEEDWMHDSRSGRLRGALHDTRMDFERGEGSRASTWLRKGCIYSTCSI